MSIKSRYSALKRKIIQRKKEFDSFVAMLENKTGWLSSPASRRFHLNEEKGLLKHSVAVAVCKLRRTVIRKNAETGGIIWIMRSFANL